MDNVRFHIVGMKEPDYVMMIMTTYSTLVEFGEEKRQYMANGVKHVTTFRYPEAVLNDNALAKQSFLLSLCNHHGECPKCGNLLLKQAENGKSTVQTTYC